MNPPTANLTGPITQEALRDMDTRNRQRVHEAITRLGERYVCATPIRRVWVGPDQPIPACIAGYRYEA
jgi:hypothetical protein